MGVVTGAVGVVTTGVVETPPVAEGVPVGVEPPVEEDELLEPPVRQEVSAERTCQIKVFCAVLRCLQLD